VVAPQLCLLKAQTIRYQILCIYGFGDSFFNLIIYEFYYLTGLLVQISSNKAMLYFLINGDVPGSKDESVVVMGRVGSIFSSSGWVSHLWFGFGFGKFPLKM